MKPLPLRAESQSPRWRSPHLRGFTPSIITEIIARQKRGPKAAVDQLSPSQESISIHSECIYSQVGWNFSLIIDMINERAEASLNELFYLRDFFFENWPVCSISEFKRKVVRVLQVSELSRGRTSALPCSRQEGTV